MKQRPLSTPSTQASVSRPPKELFLIEMDQVVPWKGLLALIEPYT
ncbi:Mobile element protein [Collimonas arenae]|uniref:Mobile element protein n=1 Tax=Collimonas arenae TaxID=279058 RepID=A0A0A1F902_9BURK|nr:Mobile element protein [Collimonas arenae]